MLTLVFVGRVDTDLARRCLEDEPAAMSINVRPPQHVAQEGARLGILPDWSNWLAYRGGGARKADQEHIFLPDFALDVGTELRCNAAFQAGFEQTLSALGRRTVEFAEQQALHRPCLSNDAGAIDRSGDIADAAHYA